MMNNRVWLGLNVGALVLLAGGVLGCAIGASTGRSGFFQAWLCSYLFWLGVPLAGVTLVLVHDLSGGGWMASARPVIEAAVSTMPLASLAGIPAFLGLRYLYTWTHSPAHLANAFYLNSSDFLIRYAAYLVIWNLAAAFALWGLRAQGGPISPSLSWLSGIGLVALAFSTGFASIDWILSLEPTFWSSAFPYAQAASWFNTGLALILLAIAISPPVAPEHLADLVKILLATTIFWAYVEFVQFLIIWEENLKTEIPWYVKRLSSVWHPAIDVSVVFGFVVPFFLLLWSPAKRNRGIVALACALILISRVADKFWLVLPEFSEGGPFWLDIAAFVALGAAIMLIFGWGWRYAHLRPRARVPIWTTDHG